MSPTTASVAILLFTRSAGEEAAHKQFVSHGARAANAAVAARLIAHATATAQAAGVDFLCVDSRQQRGATFGQRLSAALQQAFAQGYEHLLVMGNDCPQLTDGLLRRAVAALRRHGAVLGPATDGGVYLLGVSRALFEAGAWAALPWQTAQLGAALQGWLRQQGAVVALLPTLADIDNEQDLAQALRQPLARLLARQLHRLRTARRPAARPRRCRLARQLAVATCPHRGPPAS
ncbi:DUF2064 domain-containing protein [Hymenobacter sp. ASUV-10]|uniref:DUF2064 domain-containing protein n=1 Tax=Hymenobacter aranciens TaxID=3063996 RepID=A0ABT9B4K0_9BACT|nr:DUF2064 domain-containing protein [Hymenobacter sp. ASUV-10]MDO7873181.1 DUF2064 domain-containing protein [Hymenobacter sp. ASUV-10]